MSGRAAMKVAALCFAVLARSALCVKLLRGLTGSVGSGADRQLGKHTLEGEKPITQVVRLLEEMLKKSAEEQEKDRVAYAKFKCYCDTQTEEKEKIIEEATKAIEVLESDISALQGSNGVLSTEAAQLQKEIDDTQQAMDEADSIREKEETAYTKLKDDLEANIPLLGEAIETLGAIGADQTLETSQAHNQFMAGFNESEALLSLESNVRTALVAAEQLVKPGSERQKRLSAFLQAPLGTTYEVQSGEIVGILREMKETFEENLAEATAAEKAAIKAHEKFIEVKTEEKTKLQKAFDDGQDTMGANDDSLSSKKDQLEVEIKAKEDAEEFLSKLEPMCSDKAKDYEARKLFRSNEQTAISQCIAFLNSDAAFKTFSKIKATGGAAVSFVQISEQRSSVARTQAVRRKVEMILSQAARDTRSTKLARLVATVHDGNPFDVVLAEIEKIKKLIEEEGEQDKEQKEWCEDEQKKNEDNLKIKKDDITKLEGEIEELEENINDPDTGLKVSIETKEGELEENSKAQKEETEIRQKENVDYQSAVADTSEARALLKKAIEMLEVYYKEAYKEASAQFLQEDPAPPDTWEDGKIGTEDVGNNAITTLETLLKSTEDEEASLHETEQKAQSDYETSMGDLKDEEKDLQDALSDLQEQLAEAEKSLINKKADLVQTKKDKEAIELYLEQIKPGCDFIIDNIAKRDEYRKKETEALDKAVTLLEGSPAYKAAQEAAKEEGWGDCQELCLEHGESHAKCLACNAKVSVPGYCAGHADISGCDEV